MAKPSIVFVDRIWADSSSEHGQKVAWATQRFVAKRIGAHAYEVDASHVPMLSNRRRVDRRHASTLARGATLLAVRAAARRPPRRSFHSSQAVVD